MIKQWAGISVLVATLVSAFTYLVGAAGALRDGPMVDLGSLSATCWLIAGVWCLVAYADNKRPRTHEQ